MIGTKDSLALGKEEKLTGSGKAALLGPGNPSLVRVPEKHRMRMEFGLGRCIERKRTLQ